MNRSRILLKDVEISLKSKCVTLTYKKKQVILHEL